MNTLVEFVRFSGFSHWLRTSPIFGAPVTVTVSAVDRAYPLHPGETPETLEQEEEILALLANLEKGSSR